jgi:hemolysin type calcium-binding protein
MRRAILLLTVMAAALVVASGVALAVTRVVGGPGNDVVLGTEGPDDLAGGGGSDSIIGFRGKDVLTGGLLAAKPGELPPPEGGPNNDDIMIGGSDNDLMDGNLGSDQILSGTGDDILVTSGGGSAVFIGGTGNDVLWPRNEPASQDLTLCGAGTDVAHVDEVDVVVGCEEVWYRHPTDAEWAKYLAERGLQGRV